MTFAPSHILVPVAIDPEDDFFLAEHAVFAACDIAEKFGSKITLLHLSSAISPGMPTGIDISGKIYHAFMLVLQARLERGLLKIKELEEVAKNRGIKIDGRIVESIERTPTVILKTAEELTTDLIVLGSHGRAGLSHLLFGSVAEQVAKKSHCPVLLLHPKLTGENP